MQFICCINILIFSNMNPLVGEFNTWILGVRCWILDIHLYILSFPSFFIEFLTVPHHSSFGGHVDRVECLVGRSYAHVIEVMTKSMMPRIMSTATTRKRKWRGSLGLATPPFAFATEFVIDSPQLGQAVALDEISFLHAGHLINGIFQLSFFFFRTIIIPVRK